MVLDSRMLAPPEPVHAQTDARWGSACLAYNVQIDLTPAALEAIVRLQQNLDRELQVPLHLTPAESMHVSVYAIAPYHWESPDKEAYWRDRRTACTDALSRSTATIAHACLAFTALRVLPRAVILVASDPGGQVAATRAALRAVSAPDVPTPAYDLVHTTIARYAADRLLAPDAVQRAEAKPIRIASEVSAMRVVRERVYPSLVLDDVARFPLRA
ncbi:MAG: hypothetical protein ABW252_08340 [Polyangiales bacterium]